MWSREMGVVKGVGCGIVLMPWSCWQGLSKEEERLIRRISGGYPNGSVKIATETNKRKSLDSDVLMN